MAILAVAPDLYLEAIRLGVPKALISLLTHENTDIIVAGIDIIAELTDDDVINPEDGTISLSSLKGIKNFVNELVCMFP
jgi:beta-catenin-like protein 1